MLRFKDMYRLLISALLIFPLFAYAGVNDEKWNQAASLYAEQKYDEAALIYEDLLKSGESAELYYNYANTLYKTNRLGEAILNYERSLRLDPSNRDAKFNLELANAKITDKITPVEQLFFVRWNNMLRDNLSSNQWVYVSVSCFIIFLVLSLLYMFGRARALRKTSFFLAIAFLIVTIVSFAYSFSSKSNIIEHSEAIVMSGSVSVKSSPDQSGTEIFILHEGSKIKVISTLGEWGEIQIADGNVGWLPLSDIERI